MNKTSDITEIFEQKAQEIGKEAKQKLEEVRKKFQEHEQNFKDKISNQFEQIKSVLEQLDNGGNGKIKTLEDKIDGLVGRPVRKGSGRKTYGRLVTLYTHMFSNRSQYTRHLSNKSFLKENLRTFETIVERVESMIRKFVRGIDENRRHIYATKNDLVSIIEVLRTYKEKIRGVLGELEGFTESNIDGYKSKIDYGMSIIKGLVGLGKLEKQYSSSLEEAKKAISSANEFKSSVKGWGTILSRSFMSLVEAMPNIEVRELQEIKILLGGIIGLGNIAKRHFGNSRRMLDYLKEFNQQMETITKLSINGTSLKQIDTTIQNVQKASTVINQAKTKIEEAKQTLENGLVEDSDKGDPGKQTNGERQNMMPEELKLDENGEFKKFEERLTAIREFKETLTGITSGMSKLTSGTSQQSDGPDVQTVLSWLEKIDETLTTVYMSVEQAVTEMEVTYGRTAKQINAIDSSNSEKIKSYVDKIKQIPGKIAEFHSKVKYYIVFLNIAKSVNETLESVQGDANRLGKIDTRLPYINSYTGFMKKG